MEKLMEKLNVPYMDAAGLRPYMLETLDDCVCRQLVLMTCCYACGESEARMAMAVLCDRMMELNVNDSIIKHLLEEPIEHHAFCTVLNVLRGGNGDAVGCPTCVEFSHPS